MTGVCEWCGQAFKLVTVGVGVKTTYILMDHGMVHVPPICKRTREARAAELEKEADASRPGKDLK